MEPEQKTLLCRIAAAAALLALLFFLAPEGIAALPLFALPYLLLGWDVLREAGKSLLRREAFDENFLMALATLGAMALGNYWEAAAVLLLYRVGELFEDCAVGKSRSSIRALLDIRPDTAALEAPDGTLRTVHPAEVAVGSVIVVRPGERIPLDGVVVSGEGLLDTSALTGESLPRSVGVGDRAASGCISLDGLLRLRTDCTFGASTASRILALAEQSGERKSRCERFLTRFARRYTPAVCLAALLLALLPPCIRTLLGLAGEWRVWLYRALTFLVISCPCALVIGIPLAFFAAIGGASRAGILIKSSDSLEALARVDQVAFDKTGTLTSGVLTVGELFPAQPDFPLLHVAAAAEQYAAHPIARSLCAAAEKPLPQAEGVQEIAGCGVLARVDGLSVAVGNAKLMAREGVPLPASLPDGAVVFVAADGVYRGAIRLCDTLKPTARDAVAALRRAGVSRCVLLTGDTQRAAEETARQTGCDAAYASLLPEDKVACVEAMLSACGARRTLAFVGDGINDSPVLARADVGVAMGALGSDAAVESADVVLMDDDPRKVALALRHARRCMKIVTENIVFSIAVKVICLTLGALGLVGMGAAVFADVGTMVLAVCNAMRALRSERREKDVR